MPETYRHRAYYDSSTEDEVDRVRMGPERIANAEAKGERPPGRSDHEHRVAGYYSEDDVFMNRERKRPRGRRPSPPAVPAAEILPNNGQEKRADATVPDFMREKKAEQGPLSVVNPGKERNQSSTWKVTNRLPTYTGRSTKGYANIRSVVIISRTRKPCAMTSHHEVVAKSQALPGAVWRM